MIFSCRDIQKSFGADTVLRSVSFMLEDGEKAAVVGMNGAGKTTLFRIINGETLPDAGELTFRKGATIGYLPQQPDITGGNTVYDELLTVFADAIALERDMRELETIISRAAGDALSGLLQRYEKLQSEFEHKRGYTYKSLVRGVVKGLGFTGEEERLPVEKLSGGQKTRLCLGKLLLCEPSLLLLDEPTNHLDLEAVAWLEEYLSKSFAGSLLVISHDRYFLDKMVKKVVEIDSGASKVYIGNYSGYAYQKEADRDQQLRHYVNQQREIKRQEEIIRRFRSYAQEWSLKRAKTREKMLAKVQRLEPPRDTQRIRILLEPRKHSGRDVLHVENLSMAFAKPLFDGVNIDIYRGEVVARVGPNGVGKTTLLNILLGRLSGGGLYRLGTGVVVGYYDQEQRFLDEQKTVLNEIYDAYPNMTQAEIRSALAAFMFCGDDVFKPVGALSGGEKGRLSLAKLMLGHSNFLLMDEPTNHLDIFSREVLEEAVRNYTGTVLYVSHDRYFISSTADKIIELAPDGATTYAGGYDYYVEKRAERAAKTVSAKNREATDSSKEDWQRKKDAASRDRKRETRIQKIEQEIKAGEERISELEAYLMRDDVATDPDKAARAFGEKTELEERVHGLYEEWGGLTEC